jgi:hypothetical protein
MHKRISTPFTASCMQADGLYASDVVWHPPSLTSNSSWCPHNQLVEDVSCGWFSILASDGRWYNASDVGLSGGGRLVLTAPNAPAGLVPVATSNGYADWPVVNVYSAAGLPLVPWPPRNVTSASAA